MLCKFQQAFMAAIYQQPGALPASEVQPSTQLSAKARLAIYQDSVASALIDALIDVYPVCRRLLGEEFFDAMAQRYVAQTPSTSADIGDYGQYLDRFMADFAPLTEYPYMADVATLEWQLHKLFYAADDQPLSMERLALVPPEQQSRLIFRRPHASAMMTSPYPVDRLWQANQEVTEADEEGSSTDQTQVDIDNDPVRLLVWRCGYELCIDRVDTYQWAFLTQLRRKDTFEELFHTLTIEHPNMDISMQLAEAIQRGWICDFELYTE